MDSDKGDVKMADDLKHEANSSYSQSTGRKVKQSPMQNYSILLHLRLAEWKKMKEIEKAKRVKNLTARHKEIRIVLLQADLERIRWSISRIGGRDALLRNEERDYLFRRIEGLEALLRVVLEKLDRFSSSGEIIDIVHLRPIEQNISINDKPDVNSTSWERTLNIADIIEISNILTIYDLRNLVQLIGGEIIYDNEDKSWSVKYMQQEIVSAADTESAAILSAIRWILASQQ
jgi:hypothetical protein